MSPIKKITICADPLSAALISSLIVARLPNGACDIDVFLDSEANIPQEIYARPNIRHVHQLLQVREQELTRSGVGEMRLSLPAISKLSGRYLSPLGEYGYSWLGCEFQHFWQRAFMAGKAEDLEYYNLALRASKAGCVIADTPPECPVLEPGYVFNSKAYAELLFSRAREFGPIRLRSDDMNLIETSDGGKAMAACLRNKGETSPPDLMIHVNQNFSEADQGWRGNYLSIQPSHELPGIWLYQIQSALKRLFDLWPRKTDNGVEAREYNRLLKAETKHISDMQQLLGGTFSDDASESLRRKIDIFQTLGRIPFEDYDVFSRTEWIAALRASNIKAKGYSRLADRVSLDKIVEQFHRLDKAMTLQINKHCKD